MKTPLPSFRTLFTNAWHELVEHWKLLMTVSLGIALIQLLVSYVLPSSWTNFNQLFVSGAKPGLDLTPTIVIIVVLAFVVNVILQSVLYYSVVNRTKEGLTLAHAFNGGLSVSLKILAVVILKTILTLIGFVLFIIPGILAWVWLSFAEFASIKENLGVIESLKRSKELTRGFFAAILGRLLLMALVVAVPTMILSLIPAGALIVTVIATPLSILYFVNLYEARLSATSNLSS
ncbi:MAG: hypothetical protein HYZ08_03250 [Candidatus Kerfeldbacteria bacterium]|nr:hypothetical protein [Candidatus Kerfeldbacteria bacterium]